MTTQKLLITVIILSLSHVTAIWPPAYKINLSHEETFVISEEFGIHDDDIYDTEDEMIKGKQLKSFNLEKDSGKYFRLHQLSVRRNRESVKINEKHYNTKRLQKSKEFIPELEELQPFKSGFVDKNGNIKSDIKKDLARKAPSANKSENKEDTNYDYNSLKAEYDSNIKQVQVSNDTLNYTEIKEEESLKDAINVMANKVKKINCTAEEKKGIGLNAARCFMKDLKNPQTTNKQKSQIFHRIGYIILIWLLVYFLVAIPCWCQRGWCCCCFQCKFCRPHERINEAKKYLLDNPLGVYHSPGNEKIVYKPTAYEKYAQKKLENAILKL